MPSSDARCYSLDAIYIILDAIYIYYVLMPSMIFTSTNYKTDNKYKK